MFLAEMDRRVQMIGTDAISPNVLSASNKYGRRGHHHIALEPLLRAHRSFGLRELGLGVLGDRLNPEARILVDVGL